MLRRFVTLLLLGCLTVAILYTFSQHASWRPEPASVPLKTENEQIEVLAAEKPSAQGGAQHESQGKIDPHAWRDSTAAFKEPKVDSTSPYAIGKTKPQGSNYTKCLVIPHTTALDEDISWINSELHDLLDSGLLTTAIYIMDDGNPVAPLHPPQNKGHEVMAYLTYIIDFYDSLPDVAIFMHAHRYAWHNNLVLEKDSSLMVRMLSPERVTREGYMNLRCHWEPGCPDHIRPGAEDKDEHKQEEAILAESWKELFPGDPIPTILAQPCCAQFAVSRERIRAIPKSRFIALRDWVLRTPLSDFLSGRIFEYTWQYIFTSTTFHCPSMSACYCDGYGFCFGDPKSFDYYFELNYHLGKYKKELDLWDQQADAVALAPEDGLGVPEVGRNITLKHEIQRIEEDMNMRREAALERGRNPRQRAKEAGRSWREGDGF